MKPLHAQWPSSDGDVYLDRLTAPSDGMMWRPSVDHGQKHELGGATLIGRLDIIGPITEGHVLINAQMSGLEC